jgi:hypothetical protein
MKHPVQRAKRVFLGLMIVYVSLVATHQGEFWPFSIFPMFSQAGKSWDRIVVRELSDEEIRILQWKSFTDEEHLLGEPFALSSINLDQNDLAGFVRNTSEWTPDRIEALQTFFKFHENDSFKLVFSVVGEWDTDAEEVRLIYTPILALNGNSYLIESSQTTIER